MATIAVERELLSLLVSMASGSVYDVEQKAAADDWFKPMARDLRGVVNRGRKLLDLPTTDVPSMCSACRRVHGCEVEHAAV